MMTALLLVAIVLMAVVMVSWVWSLFTGCALTWAVECSFQQTAYGFEVLGSLIAELVRINSGSSDD